MHPFLLRALPALAGFALAFAAALLAAPPAAGQTFEIDGDGDDPWLHLTVDEARPDGATVRLNLPLALVEAVVAALPEGDGGAHLQFDDTEIPLAELEDAWRRLGGRSGQLLAIDEPRHRTVVARRGGQLVVDSRDRRRGDERVVVRIAAPVVDALFAGPGDRLDLAGAVRAMARAGAGEITAESDDGDRVRVWVDDSPGTGRARGRR
ncbi:MAG TPA: hypothetical protein VHM02_06745 [Thermoanaerobaculia bacterium]|nr:hypothetical protein [Thermoanaerobaculia bacterium]